MIDRVLIKINAGNGGNGCISGRREKDVPKGGPDGGDGGDGGSVLIRSTTNINTLKGFQYKRMFSADHGGNGGGNLKHGDKGSNMVLEVPLGTQVWIDKEESELAADLAKNGQWVLVAKGGKGGKGNKKFSSSTNRFPMLAEGGSAGESVNVRLELKLLADVGIIGVPNAGKSSLLAAVTAAKPKIAGYPFTTIDPALGVVDRNDHRFLMVDIPGIIEGAHKGVGLGHDFLRHVERTSILVHVVDGSSEDPIEAYNKVNRELKLFNSTLHDKPQIIAINKIDIPNVRACTDKLQEKLSDGGVAVRLISAVAGEGLESMMDKVVEILIANKRSHEENKADLQQVIPVLKPRSRRRPIGVRKVNDGYVVHAPMASRIAAMIDESNWEARTQFYRYLKHLGVVKALEEVGIKSGDTVYIGELEWEWS